MPKLVSSLLHPSVTLVTDLGSACAKMNSILMAEPLCLSELFMLPDGCSLVFQSSC